MNNRWKAFYGLLIFLAAEAIQLIIIAVLQIIYGLFIGIRIGMQKGQEGLSDSTDLVSSMEKAMSQNVIYLISVIAIVGCGIAFFFWYRAEIRGEVRGSVHSVLTTKSLRLLLSLGIGCQFAVTGILCILQKYFAELFADYAQQMERLTDGNTIVVLLLMVFIAPITEELIFRGVILHYTNRVLPFWGANLLQATLFGIYHFNIIQGLYAALLGVLLGFIYRKFKTIYASMMLHLIVNTSSLLVIFFPDNGFGYLSLFLMGVVLVVISMRLLKLSELLVPEHSVMQEGEFQDTNL